MLHFTLYFLIIFQLKGGLCSSVAGERWIFDTIFNDDSTTVTSSSDIPTTMSPTTVVMPTATAISEATITIGPTEGQTGTTVTEFTTSDSRPTASTAMDSTITIQPDDSSTGQNLIDFIFGGGDTTSDPETTTTHIQTSEAETMPTASTVTAGIITPETTSADISATSTTDKQNIFDWIFGGGDTTALPGTTTLADSTTTAASQSLVDTLLNLLGLGGDSGQQSSNPVQAIIDIIQGQGSEAPSQGIITSILDVLTGTASQLPLEGMAQLLGITTKPVPNPLEDPLGFLTHPLVTPVILAAVTLNKPALLVAKASLAGGILLQSLLSG